MMRSMFAGVAGLRAHQMMMDVIGDNIANVNTTGFKSSSVEFESTLAQMVRGGSAASEDIGGVNPEQVGLGVRVASVATNDTQGALQTTGKSTDVAISGSGYFAVRSGTDMLYTRNGSLSFDSSGNLTDPTGMIVQGWAATGSPPTITTNGPTSDIKIPLTAPNNPNATKSIFLGGNLSAGATAGASSDRDLTSVVYDQNGSKHTINVTMEKTADNTWSATASENGTTLGSSTLKFDATGTLTSASTFTVPWTGNAAGKLAINLASAGTSGAITQYGGSSTAIASDQDGAPSSSIRSFAIGDDGTVTGTFSDGSSKMLAKIALATFSNPTGLQRSGDSHFRATGASGNVLMQAPGTGTAGSLAAGSLEMSNVDLGQEFTNLIIAQRGFQANSKIISASDELLQDLVNLKR